MHFFVCAKNESLVNKLKNLNISKDKCDINILLLGETGVGKSTFINAFFNYISFSTLWKARNEKLQVLIPSQFTITDENYEERVIKVGEDHNESIEVGASATQACRSYVYSVPGTDLKIRLIDTPGVGDTRGIGQDNINFENVLSFIGEFNHLNAICILLNPNNSRLTVMFEFCIKQLLSRLEKSASQNLIFVFTNTRNTFYRPGETLPALKKLLSTIDGVDILCKKKNIFCTDNESFRFLAALKNEVRFSQSEINNFSQSWTQSFEECLRMITYIVGDTDKTGLTPHEVKNTISINEARRVIVQLSQPLAEIVQLIQDNIQATDLHQKEINLTDTSLSKLRSQLYIPTVDLQVILLNQPMTVCTSLKCASVYQVGKLQKWHNRQKCHDTCFLRNVPKEIIGSPQLISCAAMNSDGKCSQCSCRYQVHMHIYYETKIFLTKLEDEKVKTTIETKEQAYCRAQSLKTVMEERVRKLNMERDTIIKKTAKFACFLKTNAIAPYNDSYEAYIEYLIDREKSMNEAADFELIKQMVRMLREYVEEKNTIMKAISEAEDSTTIITADDICGDISSLYSLEIFGSKIKELFEAQNRARQNENAHETKEYNHNSDAKNPSHSGNYNKRGRKFVCDRFKRGFFSNKQKAHPNVWSKPNQNFNQTQGHFNQHVADRRYAMNNQALFPNYQPNYNMPQVQQRMNTTPIYLPSLMNIQLQIPNHSGFRSQSPQTREHEVRNILPQPCDRSEPQASGSNLTKTE